MIYLLNIDVVLGAAPALGNADAIDISVASTKTWYRRARRPSPLDLPQRARPSEVIRRPLRRMRTVTRSGASSHASITLEW